MGKEPKLYSQKQKQAILESSKKIGKKEAAKHAEVHYTTVYDWQRQHDTLGEDVFLSYKPQSRGRGIKRITEAQEKAVLEMWERYPGYGPGQIRNQLRRGGRTISTKTVRKLMEANGYEGPRRKRTQEQEDDTRFEAERPLELGQVDILEFYIHKAKLYLLLLLDDFSRFLLGWRLVQETTIDEVIKLFQESTGRYGKLEEVLSDRGFVFYSWRGANRFEKYLEAEGIDHTHASAHHPKTLGKIEAVNKQIQKELFRPKQFLSVKEASEAIGKWVDGYNYERTHQGLGNCLVPADRFHGRQKQVLDCIREKLDPEGQGCYHGVEGVRRSLLNVVLDGQGGIRVFFLGQPIILKVGESHGKGMDT